MANLFCENKRKKNPLLNIQLYWTVSANTITQMKLDIRKANTKYQTYVLL